MRGLLEMRGLLIPHSPPICQPTRHKSLSPQLHIKNQHSPVNSIDLLGLLVQHPVPLVAQLEVLEGLVVILLCKFFSIEKSFICLFDAS